MDGLVKAVVKSNMKQHILRHISANIASTKKGFIKYGPNSFGCLICNKSFDRSDSVRRHVLIHTGQKPFACDFCEKRFNQRNKLTVHIDKVHTQIIKTE